MGYVSNYQLWKSNSFQSISLRFLCSRTAWNYGQGPNIWSCQRFIVCQRGLLDNNRYFYSISYCINIFLFVCLFVWLFGCLFVCLVVWLLLLLLLCCCCCCCSMFGSRSASNFQASRLWGFSSTDTYQDLLLHRLDILPISPYYVWLITNNYNIATSPS